MEGDQSPDSPLVSNFNDGSFPPDPSQFITRPSPYVHGWRPFIFCLGEREAGVDDLPYVRGSFDLFTKSPSFRPDHQRSPSENRDGASHKSGTQEKVSLY